LAGTSFADASRYLAAIHANGKTDWLWANPKRAAVLFQGGGSLMLVLSRFVGERIIIDNAIVIEVLEVRGNRIRLGIQAPPGTSVLRSELLRQETAEQSPDSLIGDYAHAH
jgi:carbon storage regulator